MKESVSMTTVLSKDVFFFFSPQRKFKGHFLKGSAMEGLSDLTDSSDIIQHFED